MSSASSMCQTYPAYTSGAPEDVSTALHGSGEGSLCTQARCMQHAGRPLGIPTMLQARCVSGWDMNVEFASIA